MKLRTAHMLNFAMVAALGALITVNGWMNLPQPWNLLAVVPAGVSLFSLVMVFVASRTNYR